MQEIKALLRRIRDGEITYMPKNTEEVSLIEFQETAKLFIEAMNLGFLTKNANTIFENNSGFRYCTLCVAMGGLSDKGRDILLED
ncbi:MAG: hypothetical protein B7X29_02435 [Halothiobacillus sp. 13-55-115]|jgi:hypothetical protein|nr:MAG: hypothetical protein B7X29_02435 [Halothiobacillus sp. 13-55-115]